jgi:hypothetical protein
MDNDKLLNTLLFKTFISHQWGSNLQYNHHILVYSSTSDECHVQMYCITILILIHFNNMTNFGTSLYSTGQNYNIVYK